MLDSNECKMERWNTPSLGGMINGDAASVARLNLYTTWTKTTKLLGVAGNMLSQIHWEPKRNDCVSTLSHRKVSFPNSIGGYHVSVGRSDVGEVISSVYLDGLLGLLGQKLRFLNEFPFLFRLGSTRIPPQLAVLF